MINFIFFCVNLGLSNFFKSLQLSEDLQSGIFFFGMSNSLINPLIYGAFQLWPMKNRKAFSHQRYKFKYAIKQTTRSTKPLYSVSNV